MRTRLAVVGLVAGAALLDAASVHGTAYLLLVAAVPVSAGAALLALGDALADATPGPVARLRPALGAMVLGLVLLAAAARAPLVMSRDVPAIGTAAVILCLGVLALDAVLAGAARLRTATRALPAGS